MTAGRKNNSVECVFFFYIFPARTVVVSPVKSSFMECNFEHFFYGKRSEYVMIANKGKSANADILYVPSSFNIEKPVLHKAICRVLLS